MKSENCGPICVSSKTFNKYFFLIFMCLLGFGNYDHFVNFTFKQFIHFKAITFVMNHQIHYN